jgi:hypothetical protein
MNLAQARRACVLLSLIHGRAVPPDEIVVLNEDYTVVPVATIRAILRVLEAEGLVEIDRTRRPMRVRLSPHPAIPWDRAGDRFPLEERDGQVREARHAP